MRHHIPQLVSQAGSSWRYFLSYFHTVTRTVVLALSRFESPREALRLALQQGKESALGLQRIGRNARHGLPLLIHYHIFKNAGTSFEWALEQAFGSGLHRYDMPRAGGLVTPGDIVRYASANPAARAIISHQAALPPPRIPGRRILTSILIRDPIARIRSIYAFERNQTSESPGSIKAKELVFKDYVEWRLRADPRMICNSQVHFCCRDGRKSAPVVTQNDLTKAIAALDDMDVVGTVERYEEWLSLAESVLADSFNAIILPPVRHNQTRNIAAQSEAEILDHLAGELGITLAHRLLEENELDMRLHQVADSLLTRRLAERSVLIRLRDAYRGVRAATEPAAEQES